jgi:2',5'-phosphodiesterase
MLDASARLTHSLQNVTTVALGAVLLPKGRLVGSPPLAISNSHLFFHGDAPHIRNMHTAAILWELETLIKSVQLPKNLPDPAVVFCGDLNSDLNDGIPGVVEMLQRGELSGDYWDWAHGAAFSFENGRDDGERAAQIEAADGREAGGENEGMEAQSVHRGDRSTSGASSALDESNGVPFRSLPIPVLCLAGLF